MGAIRDKAARTILSACLAATMWPCLAVADAGDVGDDSELGSDGGLAAAPLRAPSPGVPAEIDVGSASELERALEEKVGRIRIVEDFQVDRTFFVAGEAEIVPDGDRTLVRSPGFGGDAFVVGESADGASPPSEAGAAKLTLTGGAGSLTIDGNADAMEAEVSGSALFICNSAEVDVGAGVTVANCRKSGNARTLDEAYGLPYPDRIGGAAAVVANGVLNIYGGSFENNRVNDDAATDRASSMGAVVFNYSNLNIYGGTFESNSAGRGGVIYNYRMANVYGGSFVGNRASKYGGVVYQAESQFGELLVGKLEDREVLMEGNRAGSSGGALFSQTKNAVVVYGRTTFRDNVAEGGNGGAINVSGTLTVKQASFEGNGASSKGGAVYVVYDDPGLTRRYVRVSNASFNGNKASRGGAVGVMAAEADCATGGWASFERCAFEENRATGGAEGAEGAQDGEDAFGGALYVNRKSRLILRDSTLLGNAAEDEGGAVYGSGESSISIEGCTISDNSATAEGSGSGGAVSVHSCDLDISDSELADNSAAKNGGAIYESYSSGSSRDSAVTLADTRMHGNSSSNHGGAVYVTCHAEGQDRVPLVASGCTLEGNRAACNGGALYLSGARAYMERTEVSRNRADAVANASGSRYGGGAVYATGSSLELNGVAVTANASDYNGGGIALYSSSELLANEMDAGENAASAYGGAVYANKSSARVYQSSFEGNAAKNGGAVALYTDAAAQVYATKFERNEGLGNGGAAYVYTGAGGTLMRNCEFSGNKAGSYGGAVYCSNGSAMALTETIAASNEAKSGGVLYITSGGTTVDVVGMEVLGNSATSSGPIFYGNAAKAVLNVDKARYADLEADASGDGYWAAAAAGKLKLVEVSAEVGPYEGYSREHGGESEEGGQRAPVPVDDVFSLDGAGHNGRISDAYDRLEDLGDASNFMSRKTTAFEGVNGATVSVDTFVRHPGDAAGNPSFGEGILIYEAMAYKREHPERDVSIDVSSFRFSVEASVCIDRRSRYFGYMRNLVGREYDEEGFVRIAYLLVSAAKMGVDVTVIGQMDAYPIASADPGFEAYFSDHLDDPCDPLYDPGSTVGGHMSFRFVHWTSYGDDAATDMMHTKLCAVSAYIDRDGVEHSGSVWLSSTNLDGITAAGANGNDGVQTGCIVSDHDELYRVSRNYLRMLAGYCGQEDVYEFRDAVATRTAEQVDALRGGRAAEIARDEQIVYLGTADDDVFELYLSPFGGAAGVWDEVHNPFCKYLGKLRKSDDYILLNWSNVKFNKNFTLARAMEDAVVRAFLENRSPENRLYVLLPSFDAGALADLRVGADIGYKSVGSTAYGTVHSKDLQVSYCEDGRRSYVTLLNSMNLHQGSMSYQSNFALAIKEPDCSEDSVFFTVADLTSSGVVEHRYGEELTSAPSGGVDGYRYRVCEECGRVVRTGVAHDSSGPWVVDREATASEPGLEHLECAVCGEVLEAREAPAAGSWASVRDAVDDVGFTVPGPTATYPFPRILEEAPLTYEAEVYVPKSVSGRAGVIVGNYAGSGVNSVSFEVYSGGRPRIYYRDADNGKSYSYIFKSDVRTGKKEHMTIVLDGSAARLYLNGGLAEELPTAGAIPTLGTPLQLGGDARAGNAQYFKGTIYSVNVFAGARTAAEVRRDALRVDEGQDGLVYSKRFAEAACPASADGLSVHEPGEWEVDREAQAGVAGIGHVSCKACGELLEAAELDAGGAVARLVGLGDAKGLRVSTEDERHVLQSVVPDVPLTFEADVFVPKHVSGRAGVIVGNYAGPDVDSVSFEVYSGGRPRLYYRDAANGKSYSYIFKSDVRAGRRVHMAVSISDGAVNLFLDGAKVEKAALRGALPELDTPLCIGGDARAGNAQYFKGVIYSANVFAGARDDGEIRTDACLVEAGAESLVYSGYYEAATCPSAGHAVAPHAAGDWVVDEGAATSEAGVGHRTCSSCGELLQVGELPAAGGAPRHLVYSDSDGLKADGAGDVHVLPAGIADAPRTIEADVLLPESHDARGGVIVGNYSGSGAAINFEVYTDGRPRLYISNGGECSCVFSTDIRSDSKQHLAVVIGDGSASLYVNGALRETAAVSVPIPKLDTGLRVGGDAREGNAQYFKGKVFSLHLFGDERTASEVALDRVYVSPGEEGLLYGEYY